MRTTSHKTAEPFINQGEVDSYEKVFMHTLINATAPNIPEGLVNIAKGRDNLPTNEAAFALSASPQTIRKHLSLYGHFHGIKPVRIGGRLFFSVIDLARLVRGDKS